MRNRVYILGAGMTGLAAGCASGLPVYEAADWPGGICSSYYVRPGFTERLHAAPEDGEVYRFEIGGGHWIFGGDPLVLRFIRSLVPIKTYIRKSAVYFPDKDLFVPYPIQNHLRYLGPEVAAQALNEMVEAAKTEQPVTTMADWLKACFGPTLCELFFYPFHELYTAGLYKQIAPQDVYKSPVNLKLAIQGAFSEVPHVGYNVTFVYPPEGLDVLARKMAARCDVRYGKWVMRIDVKEKTLYFEDGTVKTYDELISTLPLNRMIEITGLDVGERPDPATSVLVVNIGAKKGPKCPTEHWLYIPRNRIGFHRVGFYSNVCSSFLPVASRERSDRVSIYVEKAYREGEKPGEDEIARLCREIVRELQDWEWIKEAEVVNPTWIDVAYTWAWANSTWRQKALNILEESGIYQVGRYARWMFQGIADSMKEGILSGVSLRW